MAGKKPKRLSEPVTLTMRPMYYDKADAIMERTGEKLSELVRRLINDEYDRKVPVKPIKLIQPK